MVDPGEENSPVAPAGNRTRDVRVARLCGSWLSSARAAPCLLLAEPARGRRNNKEEEAAADYSVVGTADARHEPAGTAAGVAPSSAVGVLAWD